jgi:SH3-like domain-containing protein
MRRGAIFRIAAAGGVALALAGCDARGGEGSDCPAGVKQPTPSGYCVPRYLSLKRGEVYGRQGPGTDYPVVFVYHARGLPVQVVDETSDWRRICDPDGGLVWVSSAMLEGRRTVMAEGASAAPLRRAPSDAAAAPVDLRPRSIAELRRCRGGWCEVSAGGAHGWVRSSEVWGVAPAPQCKTAWTLSNATGPANGGR